MLRRTADNGCTQTWRTAKNGDRDQRSRSRWDKKKEKHSNAYRLLLFHNKHAFPFFYVIFFFSIFLSLFAFFLGTRFPFKTKGVVISDRVDFAKERLSRIKRSIFFVGPSDQILPNAIGRAFQLGSYMVWYFSLSFFYIEPLFFFLFFVPPGSRTWRQYDRKSMCILKKEREKWKGLLGSSYSFKSHYSEHLKTDIFKGSLWYLNENLFQDQRAPGEDGWCLFRLFFFFFFSLYGVLGVGEKKKNRVSETRRRATCWKLRRFLCCCSILSGVPAAWPIFLETVAPRRKS